MENEMLPTKAKQMFQHTEGLIDIGPLDMSTLSDSKANELHEMYTHSQQRGYHRMQGPLEDQKHIDVLDWIMKKPAQVRPSFKHVVVVILSKLLEVYVNRTQ